jgi:SSS family solute:Na+ symporter
VGLAGLPGGYRFGFAPHLPLPKPDEELRGLVWGLTEKKEAEEQAWYKKPWVLAAVALAITLALNIIFF